MGMVHSLFDGDDDDLDGGSNMYPQVPFKHTTGKLTPKFNSLTYLTKLVGALPVAKHIVTPCVEDKDLIVANVSGRSECVESSSVPSRSMATIRKGGGDIVCILSSAD
jgi:hypothetical protein